MQRSLLRGFSGTQALLLSLQRVQEATVSLSRSPELECTSHSGDLPGCHLFLSHLSLASYLIIQGLSFSVCET